jgi:hypothetical protein
MAKDIIHPAVREALENDGFTILRDPYLLPLKDDDLAFQIDLSANRSLKNQKILENIIAVEVKSFAGGSVLHAFQSALGQYLGYRDAIRESSAKIRLYLAVSVEGWEKLNSINFVRRRIQQYHLKFVIIDLHTKTVLQWIK